MFPVCSSRVRAFRWHIVGKDWHENKLTRGASHSRDLHGWRVLAEPRSGRLERHPDLRGGLQRVRPTTSFE